MKWYVELQYNYNGTHSYQAIDAATPGEALDAAIANDATNWSTLKDDFPQYPLWTIRPASYVEAEREARRIAETARQEFLDSCWSFRKEV